MAGAAVGGLMANVSRWVWGGEGALRSAVDAGVRWSGHTRICAQSQGVAVV